VWEEAQPDLGIEFSLTPAVIARVRDSIVSYRFDETTAVPDLEHARVSYLNRFVTQDEPLMDVLDRALPESLRGCGGILLVVDPEPDANWGHRCWIALYDVSSPIKQQVRVAPNDFPPREDVQTRLRIFGELRNLIPQPALR
jgi:hypothetical protein